jgi:predicted N-acetyltransferase YhbS
MRIERIDELALDRETGAAISALLTEVFGDGFDGRSYYRTRAHLRLIARDRGRVVGHLALGLKMIRLADRLVDCVTVAEVATAEARRGEGIASALLAEAIAVARGTGADFMLLFGDAGLYAAAGFETVPNVVRFVDMAGRATRGVVEEPIGDMMVLPIGALPWDPSAPVDLLGAKF